MPSFTAFLSPWVWLVLVATYFGGMITERIRVADKIAAVKAENDEWQEKYKTAVKRSTDLALLWSGAINRDGGQAATQLAAGTKTFVGLAAESRRDNRGSGVYFPASNFGLLDSAIFATNQRAHPSAALVGDGPPATSSPVAEEEIELTAVRTWGIQVLGILDAAQTKLTSCINIYNDLRETQSGPTANSGDDHSGDSSDHPGSQDDQAARGQTAAVAYASGPDQ